MRLATHPRALADHLAGNEDFEFPGTADLLTLAAGVPDIVHCHNLHGGFFDLAALSRLSRRVPTVLTLHDSWLLTGHCAHSFECERWKSGCGSCPDLAIYPAIRRDRTARNWTRKRDIYRGSRLYVTTPSSWLMDRVAQSMLAPSAALSRVIPNGVDLSIFIPGLRDEARRALGLPLGDSIALIMSSRRERPWIDGKTLGGAVDRIAELKPATIFLAVGDETNPLGGDRARIRRVPYQKDPRRLAMYYRAADVYLHGARAATSPLSILEALACGTPVVACGVGGIPEQIRPLHASIESTGILVEPTDAGAMAGGVLAVLEDAHLKRQLGEHAVRDARARFDRIAQVAAYLEWYRTIIDDWNTHVRFDREPTPDLAARPVGMAVD